MKKQYTVYQITNNTNKMFYVGYHATTNLNDDYMGSGTKLDTAIVNEGINNFDKVIHMIFPTKKEALEAERYVVNEAFVARKDTYNMALGGGGGNKGNQNRKHSEEAKKRMSEANKGKVRTEKFKRNLAIKMSGEMNPAYGKCWVHNKMNQKNKLISLEKIQFYLDHGWKKGMSDLSKKKKSVATIGKNLGKRRTTTQKIKMSKIKKGQNKGKCWVHNLKLNKNKMINPEELQVWVNNGWVKGRKPLTEEHKKKIAKANKGHIVTKETREKISKTLLHHNKEV